ncbi:hypothetical protein AVEN_93134-1 [Araneus ventricosus]|uniref:Uncharacterized protein n=1 Tax=Araneus ventricosus TaxID=182803 RepID=A0A4Y2IH98_ARAVE|nr:hypothetical protein AVEN_93134-1 [Araneus ventricosus]
MYFVQPSVSFLTYVSTDITNVFTCKWLKKQVDSSGDDVVQNMILICTFVHLVSFLELVFVDITMCLHANDVKKSVDFPVTDIQNILTDSYFVHLVSFLLSVYHRHHHRVHSKMTTKLVDFLLRFSPKTRVWRFVLVQLVSLLT